MIEHVWSYHWATGWVAIVEKLLDDVNRITGEHRVTMVDLREKYGTLHIDFEAAPDCVVPTEILAEIERLALDAENASENVCIKCGQPGLNHVWSGDYLRPLCRAHARAEMPTAPLTLAQDFANAREGWRMRTDLALVDANNAPLSAVRIAELDASGGNEWKAARWVSLKLENVREVRVVQVGPMAGWANLIEKLVDDICEVTNKFTITLRHDTGCLNIAFDSIDNVPNEARRRIDELMRGAEAASERICIECGSEGLRHDWRGEWILPLCPEHARERIGGDFARYAGDGWRLNTEWRLVDTGGVPLDDATIADFDAAAAQLYRTESGVEYEPEHTFDWKAARWVAK